jgi:hypothetical protein
VEHTEEGSRLPWSAAVASRPMVAKHRLFEMHAMQSVPCRGYEITMTDLMNIFYELDADRVGVVSLADFERLMLNLSLGPDAARRLFQRLDADNDGALSLSDWTSDSSRALAEMISYKIIRHRLVGRNPVKAQIRTPTVCARHEIVREEW